MPEKKVEGDRCARTGGRAAAAVVAAVLTLLVAPAGAEDAMAPREHSLTQPGGYRGLRPAVPPPGLLAAVTSGEVPRERAPLQFGDRLAQFQLPAPEPAAEAGAEGTGEGDASPLSERGRPPRPVFGRLTYQYAYGSESDVLYRNNRDLDRRLPDSRLILSPQVNAALVYRPTDWLEATLEMILEREIGVNEKDRILLPDGEIERAPRRRTSLVVDQAYLRVHRAIDPFDAWVGRRNYEDERRWLYDASMDTVGAGFRAGRFRLDVFGGREVRLDLDFAPERRQAKDRIDTHVVHADYRGTEWVRLSAYAISRDDRSGAEGQPRLYGVRARGRPTDAFNYWTELAITRGDDAMGRPYSGSAVDTGITYRFLALPMHPSVTLSYARGSGDANPNDGRNGAFRQTGLQSNEAAFAGVSKFKYYGETLDPELSNLRILTLGLGFRPQPNVFVDLVYHRYRLDRIADGLRNAALTAELNQVAGRESREVGEGLDVVIGVRRLFGLRRLGLDLRAGWFFPGAAFLRDDGTDAAPRVHHGNKGVSLVTKFWW